MKPIAIFYHCLFALGDPPKLLDSAWCVVREQMKALRDSGLLGAANEMVVGVNGGLESEAIANLALPKKAWIEFHGVQCRNECRTIRMLENWLLGHEDWYVLYFHAKGATKPDDLHTNWRRCMMRNLVTNWRQCVKDLDDGYDAVGCHFMSGDKTPAGQSIFAGNMWWAKAAYLRTIPSIMERERIKVSGLDSIESRFEAEVHIGYGKPFPKVRDYHSEWIDRCKP